MSIAKGLVAELTHPHVQSAWGSRGERVRVAGLAACCNYFSKKKKNLKHERDKYLIHFYSFQFLGEYEM